MNPRIQVDLEMDEFGRYYHTHCNDCDEYLDHDSQMGMEDYIADHTCDDDEDAVDDEDFEPTSAQLDRLYSDGGESPAYRQQMQDAGRGGLLR